MELPCAAVVAQAGPELVDLVEGCCCEGLDIGETGQEAFVVGDDGGDLGLLEHAFADPDSVGIASISPRQIASVFCKPSHGVFGDCL